MSTSTVKYWPAAKVPEGAVYVGSTNESELPRDVYMRGDSYAFVYRGNNNSRWFNISEVEIVGAHIDAIKLIRDHHRAHQDKQSNPPDPATPARDREWMIETATNEIARRWDKSDNGNCRDHATAAVDALFPELKPAPKVVEKTAGEKLIQKWYDQSTFTIHGTNLGVLIRDVDQLLDAALAARDEAHAAAMNALRATAARIAGTDKGRWDIADDILALPLTTPEAK